MVQRRNWVHRTPIVLSGLLLLGCASTQLNYNTLDIASTVDTVITGQVLSNLAKFIESPYAIPSQVALTSGTITTNNVVTPVVTSPLNISSVATNAVAQTVAAASSKTFTNSTANTRGNVGATLTVTDQWTQTWGVAPLTDPDQLRRLRILYQFGSNNGDETDLLCNYPVIAGKPAAPQPIIGTVKYPTSDKNSVTVTIGGSDKPPPPEKHYKIKCKTGTLEIKPDAAFLNQPSCVICLPEPLPDKNTSEIYLTVNRRLKNNWLKVAHTPFGIPPGAISLGHYQQLDLYVESPGDLKHLYEFSLFVLEATTQSATSLTGESAGKGTPTKTAPLLLAPAPFLQ